jgi:hypothetical protein
MSDVDVERPEECRSGLRDCISRSASFMVLAVMSDVVRPEECGRGLREGVSTFKVILVTSANGWRGERASVGTE